MSIQTSVTRSLNGVWSAFLAAVGRLDKSLSPKDTLRRLRKHSFTLSDTVYVFHILLASFWLYVMQSPGFPLKLMIPILYAAALIIPLTSQFFVPATPVFAWLLTYYSSRFIPANWRPSISVVLLPTLESVLYGANISDILTRFTHPVLDILAWLPYGVAHFTLPFVVAAFLWMFRTKEVLHFWACAFGYMNLIGVLIQILLPCAAPWYELIYGLTPANYSMPGSPGGLARIDKLFHSNGYTVAFSNAPVVFGAFPSLHSACATIEALFISHFFPHMAKFIWSYAAVLYWATMYLTHHYLIDVVGGSCLAIACFYFFLPEELKGAAATAAPGGLQNGYASRRSKYEIYDLEEPHGLGRNGRSPNGHIMRDAADYDIEELSDRDSEGEEMDITYRSPVVPDGPNSATPLMKPGAAAGFQLPPKKNHRHTASIASLIRAEERAEDGWSPIGGSFVFPQPSGRPVDDAKGSRV
ncbi:Inositol phosphorylceramide synthase catalytic subunit aur1 [Sparassis crispa]|uniref:Inositol phosphorylceramide synthase catalytic subunit aur1 n=1 Tax=Sparassis crispa TaxID=139825 RepID=A0A401GTS5_9APHY|nr:Inositol phosphorylceramide synthase catalytic subunit aur1 [Sparassis crispa]GBE85617.1 Inositol phosphorylceramide synthase catalytic subunit aur1 [Sparassis crispa]